MTSFELEVIDVRDPVARHVSVTGELDLTNADALGAAVVEASGDSCPIALDLTQVTFVDSAALHMLFRTSRLLGPGSFGIVVPSGSPIARTFEIVGLPDLVTVRESLMELLTALAPAESAAQ